MNDESPFRYIKQKTNKKHKRTKVNGFSENVDLFPIGNQDQDCIEITFQGRSQKWKKKVSIFWPWKHEAWEKIMRLLSPSNIYNNFPTFPFWIDSFSYSNCSHIYWKEIKWKTTKKLWQFQVLVIIISNFRFPQKLRFFLNFRFLSKPLYFLTFRSSTICRMVDKTSFCILI